MGNTYGDAWIDVLYDIRTEVRHRHPSRIGQARTPGTRNIKYLVIPESDKIFPEEVLTGELKDVMFESSPVNVSPDYGPPGDTYHVTLVVRALQVSTGLKSRGRIIGDGCNSITLTRGALEEKLAGAKVLLQAAVRAAGETYDERNVLLRLTGANPSF